MQTFTSRRVILLTEPEAEEARNVLARAVGRVEAAMEEAGTGDMPLLTADRIALHDLALACGL